MSTPMDQIQPPPMAMTQQTHAAHSGHSSVGPVIAVLAVISILGVIAGMIGRLCSGRPILGYGQYDVEGWVERKCSSCLDGSLDSPPLRRPPPVEAVPVAEPVVTPPEMKEGEQEGQREKSHSTAGGGGES